ncbi:testis-expressed protein 30-like [Ruditapes philippinarum]|uniref:testis-expressed protein 30-like n=1 Tax=Ruditapes philippinarum TaxID=129788 RepID=UPI00295AF58B|nr:testis-expressed protein 30-like [Ruditapes philippinarum]
MENRLISIPYKEKIIDACVTLPDVTKTTGYGVILTHGAGGDMNLLQLKLLSEHLASKGVMAVRFTCKGLNLAYRVKVYTCVLEHVTSQYSKVTRYFLAGRSMGSRAAVGVANGVKGTELVKTVAGVIALSYPLHTQENKSNLRDKPLYELSDPICFVSGTSDEMCDKSLLENVVRDVKNSEVKWIKGANHALKVKGSKEEDIITDIGDFICDWCKTKLSGNIVESVDDEEGKQSERNPKRKVDEKNERKGGKRAKARLVR